MGQSLRTASQTRGMGVFIFWKLSRMLPLETVISFFGIAVMLAFAPGPDNVFVLMQSATNGRRAGLFVVLGLCTGLVGHTLAVTVGLAAVVAASATAFTALKLAGAAYLLYLAWGAWRAVPEVRATPTADGSGPAPARTPPSGWALYRRGIIMNLTNPKVSLFFLAFLPQFTSPARGSVALQTVSLGALFMLATLLVFGGIAFFSGLFGERIQGSARVQRGLNRFAAVVFAGLALRLLTSER